MREIKNLNEYKEVISTSKPVLLDFYADWCGPCQVMLPTVEKIATDFKDELLVAKVNVDLNRELAHYFNIRSIPTLAILQDGEVVDRLVGLQTENKLKQRIDNLLVSN